MRLTGFSRFLIVAVIVGIIGYAVMHFKNNGTLDSIIPKTTETTTKTTDNNSDSDNKSGDEKPAKGGGTSTVAAFNYTPAEPQGGTLKGVVELGASGFNMFIVKIDDKKNWKLEKAEFGSSLVYEGMTSGKDVKETLKNYIGTIVNYGVSTKNIHFVVSSGAASTDKVPEIVKGLKSIGYVCNTVDAGKEGKLALSCVLPKEYYDNSFVVDIGSGNTKISWAIGSDLASAKSTETNGAKYFQKGITEEKAFGEASAAAAQVPSKNRDICFIIGGIPFELAKQGRQGKERYTVLKAPADYKAEGEKQKAGLNLYKAIAEKTGCKTFVFDWDANFTIGFLLSLK